MKKLNKCEISLLFGWFTSNQYHRKNTSLALDDIIGISGRVVGAPIMDSRAPCRTVTVLKITCPVCD